MLITHNCTQMLQCSQNPKIPQDAANQSLDATQNIALLGTNKGLIND
jgi:hypothetical protein